MDIVLGRIPDRLRVDVTEGKPFASALELDGDQTWAGIGALPVLEHANGDVWASVQGDAPELARWDVSAENVDAVLAAPHREVRLTLGGLVWASGRVTPRD